MKVTKKLHAELITLYDNLKNFLLDLNCDKVNFRMLVLEKTTDKGVESLSYFNSEQENFIKEILTSPFETETDLLKYLKVSEDTALIKQKVSLEENGKKEIIYAIFDFKHKVPTLLSNFLKRYLLVILQRFTHRGLSITDIIHMRQEIFNDTIRQYIDLDIVQALVVSQYEGKDSYGSIAYVNDVNDAKYKIKFTKEILFSINNMRLLRKMLEIADNKLSLIVFNNKIVGIGTKNSVHQKIQFNGYQKWTFHVTPKESLRFSRGKFFFGQSVNQYMEDMPKGFISKRYEESFKKLINILSHQKHGALLIITDQAKEEVARLSGYERGYAIEPINFNLIKNLWLIKNLASVDGAVFIDSKLQCYGAGIILDGVAKRPGSSARGSRYNSSCCYLDNKPDDPYVAIVFSEDETVDVIRNTCAEKTKFISIKTTKKKTD